MDISRQITGETFHSRFESQSHCQSDRVQDVECEESETTPIVDRIDRMQVPDLERAESSAAASAAPVSDGGFTDSHHRPLRNRNSLRDRPSHRREDLRELVISIGLHNNNSVRVPNPSRTKRGSKSRPSLDDEKSEDSELMYDPKLAKQNETPHGDETEDDIHY